MVVDKNEQSPWSEPKCDLKWWQLKGSEVDKKLGAVSRKKYRYTCPPIAQAATRLAALTQPEPV